MKKLVYITALLLLAFSCFRPVFDTRGQVVVSYDWNYLVATDVMPGNLSINFYGEDNVWIGGEERSGSLTGFLLPDTLFIAVGQYSILVYNTDPTNISVENTGNYKDAVAIIATDGSKSAKSSFSTILQPASFYRYAVNETTEGDTYLSVPSSGFLLETVSPKNYVNQVNVTATFIGDSTLISQSTISITGIANGINLLTGIPFSNTGKTNKMEVSNISITDFSADFNLFGPVPNVTNEVHVGLSFVNGGRQTVVVPVTEEMQTMNDQEVAVEVKIPIVVEVNVGANGVITATLKSWDFVYEEIEIDAPIEEI